MDRHARAPQAPPAPQRWWCRRWDALWHASVRRCAFRRCHQALCPRRASGRSARRASAKDPVVEAQQHLFHLARADLSVEKIERPLAAQCTVGSLQPHAGLIDGAKHLDGLRGCPCHPIEPIRFLGVELSRLLPAGDGSRGDPENRCEVLRGNLELLGERHKRGERQTAADCIAKLNQTGRLQAQD